MLQPTSTISLAYLASILQKPLDVRTVAEQRGIEYIQHSIGKSEMRYLVILDRDETDEETIADAPRVQMTDVQLAFVRHVLVSYLTVPALLPFLPEMVRVHGLSSDGRLPLIGEEYGWD
jgi:hypothetical protein